MKIYVCATVSDFPVFSESTSFQIILPTIKETTKETFLWLFSNQAETAAGSCYHYDTNQKTILTVESDKRSNLNSLLEKKKEKTSNSLAFSLKS